MSAKKTTLEYKRKDKETPFETFLKYTDEKQKSSTVLASILNKHIKGERAKLLDIGTGNGEYLRITLDKAKLSSEIDFVLLEPSKDLITELSKEVKKFSSRNRNSISIVKNTWEDYRTDEKFDVILASHLYHIPREEYYLQLKKMIDYLEKGGVLIFVLRNIDDPYRFKMKFKPLLFGKKFQAKILDEAIEVFKEISDKYVHLEIDKFESVSELRLPYKNNMKDTISIIEFYLNKYWGDIPSAIQKDVLKFIENRKGVFKQIDGLAVVRKV